MSDPLARALARFADGGASAVGMLARGPGRDALVEAVDSFHAGVRAGLEGRDVGAVARPAIAREGLGMAAALLDALRPEPAPRLAPLLAEPRPWFPALGAGMAIARLGRDALPAALAPALRDAGWDGWGFSRALVEPHRLRGAVRLGVDAPPVWVGAGRALWFATAGDVEAIEARLALVAPDVAPHLARGLGIASAFSGGATPEAKARLATGPLGEPYLAGFARGEAARAEGA
ncbi:MAG: DUF1702 family protein [Sandaracinaceae bacterium]|nr:DUF1702 family protein [Sandaracinaceae bacterium]